MIDPTAVIAGDCVLARDVQIGPYTVIGANVEIGPGTIIGPHVVIQGPTRIGASNRIFQFASVGEDPQDKKYRGERTTLEIGDFNTIREYCTIHRGTVQDRGKTSVGNHNLLMAYTHVAHDCVIGNHVVMANAASLAGHVHLEDHVTLGGFTLVHQFCRIGCHAFSAMGSHINKDIPPFVMVGGQPTRPRGINQIGLERSGMPPDSIRAIRQAYKYLYKSELRLEEALECIENLAKEADVIRPMLDFLHHRGRSLLR